MDFALPADLLAYLDELDAFIAAEIKPLEQQDDNIRFFDHRREWARTDFENGGLPRHEWESCWSKPAAAPTRRGTGAFPPPRSTAARMDPTSGWQ